MLHICDVIVMYYCTGKRLIVDPCINCSDLFQRAMQVKLYTLEKWIFHKKCHQQSFFCQERHLGFKTRFSHLGEWNM